MLIKVHVTTDGKKDAIIKKSPDTFLVSVKELKERGLANKKVLELVREYFQVYNGTVRIVTGHHAPQKIISIMKK